MSRKHFQALADSLSCIKPEKKGVAMKQWVKSCQAVADACRGQNYNFDRARFLSACGCDD